jgi:hypothetical protein
MFASLKKAKSMLYPGLAAMLLGLCLAGSTLAAPPGQGQQAYPAEASKVHVIYLVNNHGDSFGIACQKDCDGLRATLNQGFGIYQNRLVHHDLTRGNPLTGRPLTQAEMQDYINSIRLGSNDIAVVFVSSHGRMADLAQPEASHYFQVTDRVPTPQPKQRPDPAVCELELRRGWVQSTLLAQNPRAVIILSDCCSAFNPRPPMAGVRGFDLDRPTPNAATVQSLFLRVTGLVSITAADDNRCGIVGYSGANPGNAGSAFTVAMLRLVYDQGHTYSTWGGFFPTLREETYRASSDVPNATPHRARAFHLGGSPLAIRN